jgi:hypothetical protein
MLVEYHGPPEQYNADVANALAADRDHVDVELPDSRPEAAEGATVTGTDPAAPASGFLEPGRIYDLPGELAKSLTSTSQWWKVAATDFSKLSKTKLREAAKARGIEGYTTMDEDELVAALRSSSGPAPVEGEQAAAAGGEPETASAAEGAAPATSSAPVAEGTSTTGGAA